MPYLVDYKHDAFVSYAHAPRLTEWSRAFVKELEEELNYVLRCKDPEKGVDLWMDPQLLRNQPLQPQLQKEVEGSAILIVIMSRFYLDSAWCGNEVSWFEASSRSRTDPHARVFIVRAEPTATDWPAVLQDLTGYPFHPERGSRPFGFPVPKKEDGGPFYEALFTLVDQIKLQLDLLGEQLKLADVSASAIHSEDALSNIDEREEGIIRKVFIDGSATDGSIQQQVAELLRMNSAEVRILIDFGQGQRDPLADQRLLEEITKTKAASDGIAFVYQNDDTSVSDWIRRYVGELVPAARRLKLGILPSPVIIDAVAVDGPPVMNGVPVLHFAHPSFATRLREWVDGLSENNA